MSYHIPDYYPPPQVEEINLGTEEFPEDMPPHIPLRPGLGEALVRSAGPVPDAIARRALRRDDEWVVDPVFSISLFIPPDAGDDAVAVVEKKTDDGPLRDYYQCGLYECADYMKRLMTLRPKGQPDEQWFVSVVNNVDMAREFEDNGVGPTSRELCDFIDVLPPEMICYGMPDAVEESNSPASDLFETVMDYD